MSQWHSTSGRCLSTAAPSAPQELGDRLLSDQQQEVIEKEKLALESLLTALDKLEASKEDLELVRTGMGQLNGLFMLVVVGEFNSGKSSFLNAILGGKHLEEGVTPTTARIHVIRHGPRTDVSIDPTNKDLGVVRVPVDWLKEIQLVDTPGTNAIIRSHEQITEHFIPQSDMILFVTSCDRAFSESERLFLEKIEQWNKKVVVVLSKVDILDNEAEVEQVKAFVETNFKKALGIEPVMFTISSKQALKAKEGKPVEAGNLQHLNRFADLEKYILTTLDPQTRAKIKLENPVNVGKRLINQYMAALEDRLQLLKGDVKFLDDIQAEIKLFKEDMKKDFVLQCNRIDSAMVRLEQRGDIYLEQTLRLGNLAGLSNEAKLKADFEKKVVGETSHDIDRLVSEIIDWMVEKNSKQWAHIMKRVENRAKSSSEYNERQSNKQFDYNRKQLLDTIGVEVNRSAKQFDREAEALKFTSVVRSTLFQTLAVTGAGALGLGAVLSASLLDLTGLIGASVVAVGGLCIIPYKRRVVKKEFLSKVEEVRKNLVDTTTVHFETELDNSAERITEALGPYATYVRREQLKLVELSSDLDKCKASLEAVQEDIYQAWAGK